MKSSFSPVEMGLSSSLRSWLVACGATAALGLAGASYAATVTGTNAYTTADGHASVLFDFDFGAPVELGSFLLTLNFDDAALASDQVTPFEATQGLTLPADFLTDGSVYLSQGYVGALFFGSLQAESHVQLKFNFLSALKAGESSPVTLDFEYVNAQDEDLEAVTLPTATATVSSAVPEPESLALLLAGAGVVTAWGRRRTAGAVHA